MADTPSPYAAVAARYRRYIAAVGVFVLLLFMINGLLTKPVGSKGIPPGQKMPPFAVPLALARLTGDANVATHPGDGEAGKRPACAVRGQEILNICQLYERGPVVLALFLNAGSCAAVLGDLRAIAGSFPEVGFAAVAIKGSRPQLRTLVAGERLGYPVGYDEDGALTSLYQMASCPQVTFAFPGGTVQRRALLRRPGLGTLRADVTALVAASRARGWSPPSHPKRLRVTPAAQPSAK